MAVLPAIVPGLALDAWGADPDENVMLAVEADDRLVVRAAR